MPAFHILEKTGTQGLALLKSQKNNIYMLWFYLFAGSFILGIIVMNIGNSQLLNENGIFSYSEINRLKYMEINGNDFFTFVLKKRLIRMLVVLVLTTTAIGTAVIYFDLIWKGFLAGMFFTAAAVKFGLKGMLLIMAGSLPHQLLLFPAGIMLLCWCYENCCNKNLSGREERNLNSISRARRLHRLSGSHNYLQKGILLLWIFVVLLIGCILESYVNPILIFEIMKLF